MEIVKAFSSNKLNINVTVKGDHANPLFRASDIGLVIENANIHCMIHDMDDSDKVIIPIDTNGGRQNIVFLTETGLYEVLCKSRKPIAKIFRKWVCEVVREIRITGSYTLQNQLELAQQQLEDNKREIEEKRREIAEKEEENKRLQDENSKIANDKTPVIYIYNVDRNKCPPELKIGYTINVHQRIRHYKQVCKFGKLELVIPAINIRNMESIIHNMLHPYQIKDEVFQLDIDEAKNIVTHMISMATLMTEVKENERILKISQICDYTQKIIKGESSQKTAVSESWTQTDFSLEEMGVVVHNPWKDRFDQFIDTHCILHEHAEVHAKDIVGLQRLVAREAKQEITAAFTDYLKRRFKYDRLRVQNTDKIAMGYHGVTLKPIEYKRCDTSSQPETFVFDKCVFRPGATALVREITEEYKEWKRTMNLVWSDSDELSLKTWLKSSPHLLFETVWTQHGNGQGFYGLALKRDERIRRTSSTATKIEKRDLKNNVLSRYASIAKAAEEEGMSAAKMSRCVKNRTRFDDYYYVKSTS